MTNAAEAEEAAAQGEAAGSIDWSLFQPGSLVAGSVHDVKEFGLMVDLEDHPDVVGLVTPMQMGDRQPETGEVSFF